MSLFAGYSGWRCRCLWHACGRNKPHQIGAMLDSFFRMCHGRGGGARTHGGSLWVCYRGWNAGRSQGCPAARNGTSSWQQTSSHGLPG